MDLKPGSRWRSAVCSGEIVIVRPPTMSVRLECGGRPVVALSEPKPEGVTPAAGYAVGFPAGKRFADEPTGLEVLCTKAGGGTLSIDGRPLTPKEAKKLPASD